MPTALPLPTARDPLRRRSLLALAALALLAPQPPAAADDGGRQARVERERGRILPLAAIVQAIEGRFDGRLLEAELDDDDGRLVYELKWLLPDGRRLELDLDARTGEWLKLEGVRLETAFRRAGEARSRR